MPAKMFFSFRRRSLKRPAHSDLSAVAMSTRLLLAMSIAVFVLSLLLCGSLVFALSSHGVH